MRTKDLYQREVDRLEDKRKHELALIKSELREGYEYIRPLNIIKRTISKAAKSPEIQGDLLKIAINTGSAFLTKKFIVGDSKSPMKKWLAGFLQSTIAKYAGKNDGNIKLTLAKAALAVLNKIHIKKSPSPEGPESSESDLSKSAA